MLELGWWNALLTRQTKLVAVFTEVTSAREAGCTMRQGFSGRLYTCYYFSLISPCGVFQPDLTQSLKADFVQSYNSQEIRVVQIY
jgi:hypothetical protein